MINNFLNNKVVKFILTLLKIIVWIFVILIIAIILVQKIFDNKISIGNYRMFTIVSGSMIPEYDIYDVVLVKETNPEDIKIGDDVAYLGDEGEFNGKIVTHRVIDIIEEDGNYSFETKGVANTAADPIISSSQIYGVVTYKPQVLSFLSHILNNAYGFYFLIFVPIAFLIFLEIIDFIKRKEEKIEEGK